MTSQCSLQMTVTSESQGVFTVTSPGDSPQCLLSRVTLRRSVENNNEATEIEHHILVHRSECDICRNSWLCCRDSTYLLHLMFISHSFQYSRLIYCLEISILDLFLNLSDINQCTWTPNYVYKLLFSTSLRQIELFRYR